MLTEKPIKIKQIKNILEKLDENLYINDIIILSSPYKEDYLLKLSDGESIAIKLEK